MNNKFQEKWESLQQKYSSITSTIELLKSLLPKIKGLALKVSEFGLKKSIAGIMVAGVTTIGGGAALSYIPEPYKSNYLPQEVIDFGNSIVSITNEVQSVTFTAARNLALVSQGITPGLDSKLSKITSKIDLAENKINSVKEFAQRNEQNLKEVSDKVVTAKLELKDKINSTIKVIEEAKRVSDETSGKLKGMIAFTSGDLKDKLLETTKQTNYKIDNKLNAITATLSDVNERMDRVEDLSIKTAQTVENQGNLIDSLEDDNKRIHRNLIQSNIRAVMVDDNSKRMNSLNSSLSEKINTLFSQGEVRMVLSSSDIQEGWVKCGDFNNGRYPRGTVNGGGGLLENSFSGLLNVGITYYAAVSNGSSVATYIDNLRGHPKSFNVIFICKSN